MSKNCSVERAALVVTLLALFAPALVARADIFQWEYINPANSSLGKQQSTMLCPDGAGVYAASGANLSNRNLTMAYLIGADLSVYVIYDDLGDPIDFVAAANLTGANLSQADLTNADFGFTTLSAANLTGAEVRGANFYRDTFGSGGGITAAQLYSTASYQALDLTKIGLEGNSLAGVNLAGQNLTNSFFNLATLPNANFSQANLTSARLYSAGLTGANLSSASLTNARFDGATLTNANLSQANSANANFSGADLTNANLNQANLSHGIFSAAKLIHADLSQTNLSDAIFQSPGVIADLTNANLSGANLINANFIESTLTGANLAGADVRGANFHYFFKGTGITTSQLYSTASYQAHDLRGIGLSGDHDLTGVNLANQNLTSASFYGARMTGANLTGAQVRGANLTPSTQTSGISLAALYSTASYQAHDLTAISLGNNSFPGANFAGQNLTNSSFDSTTLTNANLSLANLSNANFHYAMLAGANLSGAEVRGAKFDRDHQNSFTTGITPAQLYSTASYQAQDLAGISLGENSLAGANFAGQNLANANFYYAVLDYANLAQANLAKASFFGTKLSDANLSGADARGANFQFATLFGANTSNLIQSDGHIAGLDLTAGALLVVRDYEGIALASGPIVVDQRLAMDATGTLQLVFDADSWGSPISFAPGIPVTLGGTLDLTFAPCVNVATQSGRTIDLFDWTGVTRTGAFTVSSAYTWNLSKLYTTGEVTLMALSALPGDYSGNGTVGPEDYDVWKTSFGSTTLLAADGNGNHVVDAADYSVWRDHLGQSLGSGAGSAGASPSQSAVPEPATMVLAAVGLLALLSYPRARPFAISAWPKIGQGLTSTARRIRYRLTPCDRSSRSLPGCRSNSASVGHTGPPTD